MARNQGEWFSVRSFLRHADAIYEERVTLWRAASFEDAIHRAAIETAQYAAALESTAIGPVQVFRLDEVSSFDGQEVFSLMRESELPPDEYISRFFDTGGERQNSV